MNLKNKYIFLIYSFSFKVYDVTPNKDQVAALSEWEYVEGIDFWSSMKADRVTRIMVSPFINEEFTDFLASENIKNEMTIEDVSSIYSEADYKIRQRR